MPKNIITPFKTDDNIYTYQDIAWMLYVSIPRVAVACKRLFPELGSVQDKCTRYFTADQVLMIAKELQGQPRPKSMIEDIAQSVRLVQKLASNLQEMLAVLTRAIDMQSQDTQSFVAEDTAYLDRARLLLGSSSDLLTKFAQDRGLPISEVWEDLRVNLIFEHGVDLNYLEVRILDDYRDQGVGRLSPEVKGMREKAEEASRDFLAMNAKPEEAVLDS